MMISIDETAPAIRDGLSIHSIDGEIVILDRTSGKIHQLNRTASWVWQRLDGRTPLAALAAALGEDFDIDVESALGDVARLVRELGQHGLLAGPAAGRL